MRTGGDPKAKRASVAVFTEEQVMRLIDFLKDNELIYKKLLLLLCIYTQRNISIYYRTQSAI